MDSQIQLSISPAYDSLQHQFMRYLISLGMIHNIRHDFRIKENGYEFEAYDIQLFWKEFQNDVDHFILTPGS